MTFHIMTLFPEMVEAGLNTSILGRAIEKGFIKLNIVNIRDYTEDKHLKTDDYPYGGGAGMVMQAQPVYDCWKAIVDELGYKPECLFMSPIGRTFDQVAAKEYARLDDVILLCGHYEGVDERVLEEIVTGYVSLGDFVLTGGELPAMVMVDAISRMVPGVLGNDDSAVSESFEEGLLEYPQYSRPAVWHDKKVPDILLSGDHKKVDEWRRTQAIERTMKYRPDIIENAKLDRKDVKQILEIINQDKNNN